LEAAKHLHGERKAELQQVKSSFHEEKVGFVLGLQQAIFEREEAERRADEDVVRLQM